VDSSAAPSAIQSTAGCTKDTVLSTLPSKMPRFDKLPSSCCMSDDSLTKHLTALWERDDSVVPATSGCRAGIKRKASSVLAIRPDSTQPSVSTILSQLLSSCASTVSLPVNMSLINSVASGSAQLNLERNVSNVSTAAVNGPCSLSTSEPLTGASNIFRLPRYEQVIGNSVTNEVLQTSHTDGASSSSLSATIASHIQLDSTELLRQLEQILSEPGLSQAGGGGGDGSVVETLSAVDEKAISHIQSQLMSVETLNNDITDSHVVNG